MNNEVLRFIGLLYRGKQISIASDAVSAVKKGKAVLLIVAKDASENAKKEVYALTRIHNVDVYEIYTKDEIGDALGINYVTYLSINNRKARQKIDVLIKKEEI